DGSPRCRPATPTPHSASASSSMACARTSLASTAKECSSLPRGGQPRIARGYHGRMPTVHGYAAPSANARLRPFSFERRVPRAHDVAIAIKYCGICHSDIHQGRDEWSGGIFPMVPGHEITGLVTSVGSAVTAFKPGDRVGVGTFVDSCRE